MIADACAKYCEEVVSEVVEELNVETISEALHEAQEMELLMDGLCREEVDRVLAHEVAQLTMELCRSVHGIMHAI